MFKIFKEYPNLLVAFSEKKDGDTKLGNSPEETATKNREKFFRKLGVDPKDAVVGGLVQDNKVQIVSEKDKGKVIPETDGVITAVKRIFLSVTAADCLPVFFYDPRKEVVAIAHAGWRGLAKGILPKVVSKMQNEFSSKPSDLLAAIGPGIGECHYDVKEEVAQQFREGFPSTVLQREGKLFLDLKKIAAIQLQSAGMLGKNTEIHRACTFCEKDTYFSWRRDKVEIPRVQAMLALIGLQK